MRTKRIIITFLDGTTAEHTYPDDIQVHDGVLRVFAHNYGDVVAYPLTSIKSWENKTQ